MGLAASSGNDNDDLIDKLIDANIVVTHRVETALRLVDRRRFFPVEGRYIAYKDLAWKSDFGSPGRIHISAPCIYGNVLECLDLQEGNSFLNVGSGTGYLSTVAGYLLGSNGINHGIEIHPNIVEYARSLVAETLHCPETQCYDWAVPEFACGNGLHLSPSHYSKYDRVYCGAAVPTSHRRILWELLKIDGILVMPYDDQLLQVRRQAANVFEVKIITSVSFSDFIPPTEEERSKELYSDAPPFRSISTLQFLCALSIRKIIRSAVAVNHKIHIRNFVSQQPQRTRENHVVVEFRDGEQPIAQQAHFENRQPPFREILAIVGADFVAENENEDNNEVEEAELEQRHLVRERFRMVWFRHHLRAHIANRVVRRRHLLEMEAQEAGNAETEDGQNSDVEINGNENSGYSGTSDPADTSLDATESNSDSISVTGRSKKRLLVEHEGESSLSAKRRNDDDDNGRTDKEWKNDLVNKCEMQNIPKQGQDLADKSNSNNGSTTAAIAREKMMELEESANYKNKKNIPTYSEEAKTANNSKFVEKTAENKESMNRWAEEMAEQLEDLHRKEVDTSEDIIMENISRHKERSVHLNPLDQSRNSHQNLTKVQNATTLGSSSFDSNHLEDYNQESNKSINETIQIQNSKIHKEVNDKKHINNLISSNKLCGKSDGMQNTVEANSENFPSKNLTDLKDDEIMWQNSRLYKNRVEDNSAERYDSNNKNGNLVDIGNSSTSNGHLVVSAKEGENSNYNDDDTDYDDNDNSDEDDSYDNDDNSDEDDSDEDDDEENDDNDDGHDDDHHHNRNDDVSSSSSDTEHQVNHPRRDSSHVNSRDKNELYRAVRHTAQSMSAAVDGQGSNRNSTNSVESDSNGNALEDESISRRRSDVGDELQTEEAQKREEERLEERGRQLNDIRIFASLFERRIMELPLNRALKEYIKCLC